VAVESAGPLGTRLRHVLELLDGDVAKVDAALGLSDYRPRFSPIVRTLVALGPSSIRDLARTVGVTHSAASQTVAQMARAGLVTLQPGADARQRIVRLTAEARSLLPIIAAEWAATEAAAAELNAELPMPLDEFLAAIVAAVERRPFRERIADAARALGDPALAPLLAGGARSAQHDQQKPPRPPTRPATLTRGRHDDHLRGGAADLRPHALLVRGRCDRTRPGAPILDLGLFGGAFAAAVDRRRPVLVTSSCVAAMSGVFAAQAFLDLLDGLRYIRRHLVLTAVFLAGMDAMVLGLPIALFPALNAAHFGGTPQTLGLLTAGPDDADDRRHLGHRHRRVRPYPHPLAHPQPAGRRRSGRYHERHLPRTILQVEAALTSPAFRASAAAWRRSPAPR
jgi:DNA-binding MarR family transcriptional regulator